MISMPPILENNHTAALAHERPSRFRRLTALPINNPREALMRSSAQRATYAHLKTSILVNTMALIKQIPSSSRFGPQTSAGHIHSESLPWCSAHALWLSNKLGTQRGCPMYMTRPRKISNNSWQVFARERQRSHGQGTSTAHGEGVRLFLKYEIRTGGSLVMFDFFWYFRGPSPLGDLLCSMSYSVI